MERPGRFKRERSGRFQRGFRERPGSFQRGVQRESSERIQGGVQREFGEDLRSGQGEEIKTMSEEDLGILSTMGKLGITGNLSRQQNTHNTQPNLKTNN